MRIFKLAVVAILLVLLSLHPIYTFAEETCGSDIAWTLSDDGVLTVTGAGSMYNYSYSGLDTPWYSISDQIRSVIVKEGITSLGDNAFSWCSNLLTVQLPESLTSVGECTFSYCSRLASVDFPSGVTIIKSGAFSNCESLSSIVLPTELVSIGEYAFYGCENLKEINIPASVDSIGEAAFLFCDRLQQISVEKDNRGYMSIDGVLFTRDCSTLICYPAGKTETAYNVPDTVLAIGDYAFAYSTTVQNVVVPYSVTEIGISAFTGCESLLSVELAEGLRSIGSETFSECDYLSSITLPASLVSLGDGTFVSCEGLTDIYVKEDSSRYKSIDGVLFSADGTELIAFPSGRKKSYTIPDGVVSIGDSAFKGAYRLKGVVFPSGLKSIGKSAFMQCYEISELNFPNTLAVLEEDAFCACDGLTNVVIPVSVESFDTGAFSQCDNLKNITFVSASTNFEGYSDFFMCDSNLTITGIEGSTAEAYAKREGFSFITMTSDETESSTGDEQVCSKCGYKVDEGKQFKFCPGCGNSFK